MSPWRLSQRKDDSPCGMSLAVFVKIFLIFTPTRYKTHNVALVAPVAKFVVSIGLDGTVNAEETDTALVEMEPEPESEQEPEQDILQGGEEVAPPAEVSNDGKLVVAEEILEGHITWRSLKLLTSALGGRHPILFYLGLTAMLSTVQISSVLQTWFLGVWGAQYESHAPSEVSLS